jgi:hypothetical protein
MRKASKTWRAGAGWAPRLGRSAGKRAVEIGTRDSLTGREGLLSKLVRYASGRIECKRQRIETCGVQELS